MILVDPRAGSGDMLPEIKRRVNGQAEHAKPDLFAGDFAFEGNGPEGDIMIGIERKTISDFLGSMRSDRMAIQAKKMGSVYGVSYLMLEGQFGADADGVLMGFQFDYTERKYKWRPYTLAAKGAMAEQFYRYAEMDKHLCTLENKKNLIVVHTHDTKTSIWAVVNRYLWWQEKWDQHKSADPIKTQADIALGKVSPCMEFAAKLPGVGWSKAPAVARHFKTIYEMVCAYPSEWKDVEFVDRNGKPSYMSTETAAKLYGHFRREK